MRRLRFTPFLVGLLAITALGFGVRMVFIYTERSTPLGGDAIYYDEAANLLADG
jgi:hypothetical protein